jgi:gamma-glutamyltranspeptidase/glutathione hydrolase
MTIASASPTSPVSPAPSVSLLSCLLFLAALLLMLGPPRAAAAGTGAGPQPGPAHAGGAVASGHRLATAAGLEMLHAGGNAVDAAVATALALAMVYPEAGNLGGGGFAVVRLAPAADARGDRGDRGDRGGRNGDDVVKALDFRETAPAAARRTMFLDARGQPVADASKVGPLAAGVPGSPSGLHELHRRFGRLPWARVVEPALRLARDGFEVDAHLHETIAAPAQRRLLASFPSSAAVFLPHGEPLAVGARLRQPALAATLESYAQHGPEALLGGRVAAAVEAASRQHGGVLTAADLAGYSPQWRQPIRFTAFGWQLATMPLPSAGGIALAQTAQMLERLDWAAQPRDGADRAHLLAEALRRAAADRVLLGDPATSLATAAELLDPHWIAARAASIDRRRATRSAEIAPWHPGDGAAGAGGAPATETTPLAAVDGDGNAVALTTTLNGLFGCGLYVPEIGFLNNEMDDFATAPDQKAANDVTGLPMVQGKANAVAAGKRMLSSMTPTIAWRGVELIALGARGSQRIPTHTAQVLFDLIVDHDALQAAVDRPRIHQQWLPDRLEAEPGALSAETARELGRRGHTLVLPLPAETARVNAVRRLADGSFEAAVDPRGAAALGGAGVLGPAAH